jgi:quinol monooxygenase YgiN
MNGITVMVSYRVQPDQMHRALRAIASLVSTVLTNEPDCKGIEILQDDADQTRITLLERWTGPEAFLGPHMQQPHIQAFIREASSFLGGPPEISLWRPVGAA